MKLSELLDVMDAAAANLEKLERVWATARPMLPEGHWSELPPAHEYADLSRAWADLLPGLPPVDSYRVTEPLTDPDAILTMYIEGVGIALSTRGIELERDRPAAALAEYRYRLGQSRRRAIRNRLEELISSVSKALPQITAGVPRDATPVSTELAQAVRTAVAETEQLIGNTAPRNPPHWNNLHRHLSFSQGIDWHDIHEEDWPGIQADIGAAMWHDTDPLPVPDVDLGVEAATEPGGGASTEFAWAEIGPDTFERVLFDLLRAQRGWDNVSWLTHPNAADRGRDLAGYRTLTDGGTSVRRERVIVQAKHYTSRPVPLSEISSTVAQMDLWRPPPVDTLIVATSGRFTTDGIQWVEAHNNKGVALRVELWAHAQIEALLAPQPGIVAAHGLRGATPLS